MVVRPSEQNISIFSEDQARLSGDKAHQDNVVLLFGKEKVAEGNRAVKQLKLGGLGACPPPRKFLKIECSQMASGAFSVS